MASSISASPSRRAAKQLKIVSLNINGLQMPEKRTALLRYLSRVNTRVALIQETHFRCSQSHSVIEISGSPSAVIAQLLKLEG